MTPSPTLTAEDDARLDALERALRAFMREVEEGSGWDAYVQMLSAVSTLLGAGTGANELANRVRVPDALEANRNPPRLETKWPPRTRPDGELPDEFRQTMYAVFQDEYGREGDVKESSVKLEIADLYSTLMPFMDALAAGKERTHVLIQLAYECDTDWGRTAAILVRPLMELARW